MSKLLSTVQAFMGDKGAACELVSDAVGTAVFTFAAHGTDAPLIQSLQFVAAIKGEGVKVRALRAGMVAAGLSLTDGAKPRARFAHCAAGKGADRASELASDAAGAFMLAAAEVLDTPVKPAKKDPAKVAAQAFKALASLTDKQLGAALGTDDARDVLAAIKRAQALVTLAAQLAEAQRKAPADAKPAAVKPAAVKPAAVKPAAAPADAASVADTAIAQAMRAAVAA